MSKTQTANVPQQLFQSPDPQYRAVAIQAIRYTLPESEEAFDAMLKTVLVDMLLTVLQDKDMEIRRLAMTTLNSAAHNKPDLILPHLGELVPFVMAESVIKPELIREVQMGPFKHQVDDGLEVRKVCTLLIVVDKSTMLTFPPERLRDSVCSDGDCFLKNQLLGVL
jgi:hypothetical protein